MSKQFDNTNSGALFKNDDKQSDRHPDMNGSLNVEGKEFWLSAWKKTSKKGQKFLSVSVRPKLVRDRQSPPTGGRHDPRDEAPPFDDEW